MRLARSSSTTRTPAFLLGMTILLAAAPSGSNAATLLRGQPLGRQLETILDLPGVSVNVNDSGDVVVETPWGSVNTGDNGTHIHGPAPATLGSLSCDTLGSWDTDDEPTCTTALPAFFTATATFGHGDKPKDRKKVMDDFCGVPCGEVWTTGVVADSLNCPAPTTDTDASDNDDNDNNDNNVDVTDGGVEVDVPGASVNSTPNGGVNVQAPGTSVTRNPTTGQVQVEAPMGVSVNTANGPVSSTSTTTTAKKPAKASVSSNENKAAAAAPAAAGATTSTSSSKPTYPADYPGLRMGCIKDKKDNEYCALKRASVSVAAAPPSKKGAGETPACDFYLSCCYAQYGKMFGAIPATFVEEVESACPGSKAFLEGDLCTE